MTNEHRIEKLAGAGRPKKKTKEMVGFQGRAKEYEEELNPFENRYPSSHHGAQLHVNGGNQHDFENSPQ